MPIPTPAAILSAAMALIEDESRWCQGVPARDKDGRPASRAMATSAAKWCALGALCKLESPELPYELLSQAAEHLYNRRVSAVNNKLGHAAVLECYREAIQRAGDDNEA